MMLHQIRLGVLKRGVCSMLNILTNVRKKTIFIKNLFN